MPRAPNPAPGSVRAWLTAPSVAVTSCCFLLMWASLSYVLIWQYGL